MIIYTVIQTWNGQCAFSCVRVRARLRRNVSMGVVCLDAVCDCVCSVLFSAWLDNVHNSSVLLL